MASVQIQRWPSIWCFDICKSYLKWLEFKQAHFMPAFRCSHDTSGHMKPADNGAQRNKFISGPNCGTGYLANCIVLAVFVILNGISYFVCSQTATFPSFHMYSQYGLLDVHGSLWRICHSSWWLHLSFQGIEHVARLSFAKRLTGQRCCSQLKAVIALTPG